MSKAKIPKTSKVNKFTVKKKMVLSRNSINLQKKNAKAENLKPFESKNTTKAESESNNSHIDGSHSMYSSPARESQNVSCLILKFWFRRSR